MESGHGSTIEHVNFTFAISGVTRTLSHQLVRHRAGTAFDQQSQRYVSFKERDNYTVPGSIANGDLPDDLAGRFQRAIDDNLDLYGQLLQAEVPAEDARFIFPNAMQTNLIMTVNLRQLIHMSGLRLCTMAQWEIRQLFKQIRHEVFRQSHRANLPRRSTWHASHLCADHTYRRGSITGDPTDGTATSSTSTSTPGSYAGSVPRRWGLNSGGRNHEEWSVP
jgi:flavin-dependent thymidylate synthase